MQCGPLIGHIVRVCGEIIDGPSKGTRPGQVVPTSCPNRDACANDEQRRGWVTANKAEAEAEMPQHDEFTHQGVTYASNAERM